MKIIDASFEIVNMPDGREVLKMLEKIGRVCYKSENRIEKDSAEKFLKTIIRNGHESVIEHMNITVKIICDRGVTHEIVRHRIASYSQESTRYCNYSNERFGNELTFIRPTFWKNDKEKYEIWLGVMQEVEKKYMELIKLGARAEEARSILPNSLKTEIVVTMNLREWRHFFRLRTSVKAHPQIREVSIAILKKFKDCIPVIFDDILV